MLSFCQYTVCWNNAITWCLWDTACSNNNLFMVYSCKTQTLIIGNIFLLFIVSHFDLVAK